MEGGKGNGRVMGCKFSDGRGGWVTASPGADCALVAVRDGEGGGSEDVWTEG